MSEQRISAHIAEWVATVKFEDVPRRVIDEAKNQILSVIASVHAGHFSESGRIVIKTVKSWGEGRDATLIPSGERVSMHDAIFGNCALSMALDFDDYLFAGHTGHSAVLATLAVAEQLGASGRDLLLAQIVANEVEGRVGASVLLGPLNGQMWSFLHLIGAAVSTAKLMHLEARQIQDAISLACTQPTYPLQPAFFGSEGKVLLASGTAPAGVRAAQLAANGLRGADGIFEGEHGFLSLFTRDPLLGAFKGLGKTWVTDTLCYKMYPGCAYIDSTIDCVLHLARHHHINAANVRAVHVAATPLTLGMEALSMPYLRGGDSFASTLNFSLAYNIAVALLDRELTARQFLRERIRDESVWNLMSKVRLSTDDELSRRMHESMPVRLSTEGGKMRADLDLGTTDLTRFKMSVGARVKIELVDGRTFEMEQEVPVGAAGRPFDDRRRAVEEKFRRETRYTLRKEAMEHAVDLVAQMDRGGSPHVRDFVRSVCVER